MSDPSKSTGGDGARPGPSGSGTNHTPTVATGVPVMEASALIGPVGKTYEEEYGRLTAFLQRTGDILGPSAPVVFVNIVRNLYVRAKEVANSAQLTPHDKCVALFHIFDAIVLAYKNLSFVYCDKNGARSVYGYSELALKNMLARVEAIARHVAAGVHDTYSLTVLGGVVASAEQRLSQVRNEKDMLDFFRGVSGAPDGGLKDGIASATGARLPRGVERYSDPYPEVGALVQRLYATNADKDYVRDFHDAMFLIATGNAPTNLSGALETRLAGKDRNVVLFEAAGDRLFAASMCASAIAYLRKKLRSPEHDGGDDEIETYRINYGRIFSKYRGESERNFDDTMEWIKNKVRASDKFRVFWFPDIENLMSPRSSGDQEHIATIKNAMLQHMDVFNKDRTLRSYLLLFNASEGPLDSAFARRLETAVKTPPNPLADRSVAVQLVGAELARYHINITDDLAARVAEDAGNPDPQSSRVGGFAYVQATLRDLYVNQKLVLKRDVRAVARKQMSEQTLNRVLGRYASPGSRDSLYSLNERPLKLDDVEGLAFSPASRLGQIPLTSGELLSIKYNADLQSDPKNIDEQTAGKMIFLHDL